MADTDGLISHLGTGTTTVARCWLVERRDGTLFGFTDHDVDLEFDDVTFSAGTGLTAKSLEQTTGLSIDNTEAMGALSDASVTEADILAGRFDGATVQAWLVNWDDTNERVLQFNGTIGEITRGGGAFEAELRGLTESLNQPQGNVYQTLCGAILGDAKCGFDVNTAGYFEDRAVEGVEGGRVFTFDAFNEFEDRWFERGRFEVLSGAATGLIAYIKNDQLSGIGRTVELWESLRLPIEVGDMVRCEVFSYQLCES
jgi:uncharacterized phage protein (TIGR02218 family)